MKGHVHWRWKPDKGAPRLEIGVTAHKQREADLKVAGLPEPRLPAQSQRPVGASVLEADSEAQCDWV